MNKNVIVLVLLAVVFFVLIWFYALPQWRKYHPKPAGGAPPGQAPIGAPVDQ